MNKIVNAAEVLNTRDSPQIFCLPDGNCSNCGNCCSNFLPMTKADILVIKRFIKRNKIRAITHKDTVLAVKTIDCMCPFRDEEKNLCTIYPVRPLICRVYQCNKQPVQIAEEMIAEKATPRKFKTYDVRKTFYSAEEDAESAIIHGLMLNRADMISKGKF